MGEQLGTKSDLNSPFKTEEKLKHYSFKREMR